MPGGKYLEWAEIRDFSPGIVTQPDWILSPSSAQQMDDCYPQTQGGLRAFVKPTSFSTSGIQDIAHETVIGIFAVGGIALRAGGAGDAVDRYLWTYSQTGHTTSANTVRVYRWDGTTNPVPTTWTLIKTMAAPAGVASPNPVIAWRFVDNTGAAYVIFNLGQTSADDGLWSIKYSDGSLVNRKAGLTQCCAVQDDRILLAQGSTLYWSDSQSISSFPAANNLPVQASRDGSTISCILPTAPSQLFIGTRAASWELVQGSITDPVIRTMSDARPLGNAIQKGTYTTQGMAFLGDSTGIFLTQNGMVFQDVGAQLIATTWPNQGAAAVNDTGCGDVAFQNNWLFAPHGYVWDVRTKAWFKATDLAVGKHHYNDEFDHLIFSATDGVNFLLWQYPVSETSTRKSSWTWKSAPIRGSDGRQIRFREVQVFAKPYGSGASMTITIGGVAHTIPLRHTSGFQQLSALFSVYTEEADITLTSNSNNAGIEAPSIEVIRVGSHSGHRLRN